ncbi:exopolyphosphatase [Thioalkalivibrio denitrificans]|uniref:Exopolyphosphatase n=1 Tax=Thioalkalivibrio denitrificans TaxID=108003 RepID=A0A1V3NNV9_9GAMM|nr:exopolyphosphatase [Thioalkalivibrio denitrificans]OOG26799.1 exopolyphosphatase [Thioalkalivibrio denitrificans]
MFRRRKVPEVVAAVDLGSNSFHMIVARVQQGHVHMLDRLRETVRLAAGLDARDNLTEEAMERALGCLERFGQRVRDLPQGAVRAVGTNTLRKARNASEFMARAAAALGHPIEVIGGHEEARLIYLGVSHALADDGGRRLVVDIGGGSTELIIGERFEPLHGESLYMGCVSFSRLYFPQGRITETGWRTADIAARLELQPLERPFRALGWKDALGASGTLLAVERVLRELGWAQGGVTLEGLHRLREAILSAGDVSRLDLSGLSDDRKPVFPGGVAVLLAIFEALGIESMQVSDGALREGLVYDLLGRISHEDVRTRTIEGLMGRFQVDAAHAERVETTARGLLEQVGEDWEMDEDAADTLSWAARLHELGLAIAHAGYHKHGAYLLANADLAGFSRQGQQWLALLVLAHRRKFPVKAIEQTVPRELRPRLTRLAVLLRLAVLFRRSRSDVAPELQSLATGRNSVKLVFAPGWLDAHPLTRADLDRERDFLKVAGMKLKVV